MEEKSTYRLTNISLNTKGIKYAVEEELKDIKFKDLELLQDAVIDKVNELVPKYITFDSVSTEEGE